MTRDNVIQGVRLTAQDTVLSTRQCGFDSRTPYQFPAREKEAAAWKADTQCKGRRLLNAPRQWAPAHRWLSRQEKNAPSIESATATRSRSSARPASSLRTNLLRPHERAPEGFSTVALRVLGLMLIVFCAVMFMGFCWDIGLSR